MKIVLLRHMESEKNIHKSFSSAENREQLTNYGMDQGKKVAKYIKQLSVENQMFVKKIYAASSQRAITTAQFIANEFGVDVCTTDAFLSVTIDDELKGKTEEEVRKINPKFISELGLYRCGLFNAYKFSTVANVIGSGEYERKVLGQFNKIIEDTSETMKVIVMHHSSLTATLINIARSMSVYPKNYYGRVEADLGGVFIVDYDQKAKRYEINSANYFHNSIL